MKSFRLVACERQFSQSTSTISTKDLLICTKCVPFTFIDAIVSKLMVHTRILVKSQNRFCNFKIVCTSKTWVTEAMKNIICICHPERKLIELYRIRQLNTILDVRRSAGTFYKPRE